MNERVEAGIARRAVVRIRRGGGTTDDDVAVEEPLEIRVAGDTLAVTMRTPGHDAELAVGFLLAEGLIRSVADVGSVTHCGRPGDEGYGNVIDVLPGPGVALAPELTRPSARGTLTTSACGVCGRRTIEDLRAKCAPLSDTSRTSPGRLGLMLATLAASQPNFARTGGLHAAAVFDGSSELLVIREDIGRHNAVDKAVGALVLSGQPPEPGATLLVSGRASFEIVQKAVAARISIVASVSAASSLAIDLARAMSVCLAAFVRENGSLNVYAGETRVDAD
jgi:FdhD protein